MKLRSMVVVISAAFLGATAPGFAQAGPGDGQRGGSHYSTVKHGGNSHQRGDRGHRRSDNSNGLAIALGIGLIGLAIASQMDDDPVRYAPSYPAAGPGYGYGNGYGYRQSNGNYDGYSYGLPPYPAPPGYAPHRSTYQGAPSDGY